MNKDTHEVKKLHMSNKNRILYLILMVVSTYIYGLFLKSIGDAMPFVDSFTTISSVIAMIISVKMFSEQWWIWIAVNVFSVYMWWCDFVSGSYNMATLLMWCVYLFNAIIMCIKWEKEIKKEKCHVQV
jgi:nicotinamide mononucleotide transporter